MIAALAITLASLVAGAMLGRLTTRMSAWFAPLRTFAIVAVASLAMARLVPEAVAGIGGWALLLFVAALVLPRLLAHVLGGLIARGRELNTRRLGAELGFLGFAAHQFAEGVALGTYSGPGHAEHGHLDIVVAVAAHTIPLTALFLGAVVWGRGRRAAGRRLLALSLASVLGFIVADRVANAVAGSALPVISALVSGFLCHVLLHREAGGVRRTFAIRLVDVIAAVAGAMLPLASGHSHGADGELRARVGEALVALGLQTAPMLFLGLGLGAVLQVFGSRLSRQWAAGGTAPQQALRGIAIGGSLPLCACGVLPIAEGLRARGAGVALVVAFVIGAPQLGAEAITLSGSLLGWPYALSRLAAALLLAFVAGVAFSRFARSAATPACDLGEVAPERVPPLRRAAAYFDELFLHVVPWVIVGLISAAYVEVVIPEGGLVAFAATGLDIAAVVAFALPTYVCAAAAMPVAAVLITKGVSAGAVLAGMLLGPATNAATVAVLGRAYGGRVVRRGVGLVVLLCCVFAVAANAGRIPVTLPRGLLRAADHGIVAWGALAVLAAMLLMQLWRFGIGPWLAVLEAGGHAHLHGHEHSGPLEREGTDDDPREPRWEGQGSASSSPSSS